MLGFDICMAGASLVESQYTEAGGQASHALRRFKTGVGGAGYELMRHRHEYC